MSELYSFICYAVKHYIKGMHMFTYDLLYMLSLLCSYICKIVKYCLILSLVRIYDILLLDILNSLCYTLIVMNVVKIRLLDLSQ